MWRLENRRWWHSAIRAIPGIVVVASVTFICFGLGLNPTATGFLYLIVVLLQSLLGDFVSAAVVSVIADLCLNFFFVPPVFSFRVSDSSDIWALVSFLVAALIITRLTTQVRREAQTAELHRQEIKLLYQLAQRLLALDPRNEMLANSMAQFRAVFGLKAVCLYDGVNLELHHDGDVDGDLAIRTRATYISQRESDDAVMGIFTRPLVATGRIIGAVGFDGLRDAELTAGPLTTLAATVLERLHVFRDASQASAAAQVEEFRGTILDALAHEFKTPLASIVTAAGALRESAQLSPEQLELADLAEMEASRLAQLTSRLLRVARLDREEIKPQLETIDLLALVTRLVEQYSKRWTDRKFSAKKLLSSAQVSADPELIQLALRQLLDNAAKYSSPGSAIEASVESQNGFVVVRVWNSDSLIPLAERQRIFERFYRGSKRAMWRPDRDWACMLLEKLYSPTEGIWNWKGQ